MNALGARITREVQWYKNRPASFWQRIVRRILKALLWVTALSIAAALVYLYASNVTLTQAVQHAGFVALVVVLVLGVVALAFGTSGAHKLAKWARFEHPVLSSMVICCALGYLIIRLWIIVMPYLVHVFRIDQ
jgi:hypothetical protein